MSAKGPGRVKTLLPPITPQYPVTARATAVGIFQTSSTPSNQITRHRYGKAFSHGLGPIRRLWSSDHRRHGSTSTLSPRRPDPKRHSRRRLLGGATNRLRPALAHTRSVHIMSASKHVCECQRKKLHHRRRSPQRTKPAGLRGSKGNRLRAEIAYRRSIQILSGRTRSLEPIQVLAPL
jgi:hypothetical protein